MERYEVNITNEALTDMEKIYDYISLKLLAPGSAIKQYNRIADAILTLEFFPERYTLFEMEPEHSIGVRKMVVDNYLICYVIDMGVVTVTDVLYSASDVYTRVRKKY